MASNNLVWFCPTCLAPSYLGNQRRQRDVNNGHIHRARHRVWHARGRDITPKLVLDTKPGLECSCGYHKGPWIRGCLHKAFHIARPCHLTPRERQLCVQRHIIACTRTTTGKGSQRCGCKQPQLGAAGVGCYHCCTRHCHQWLWS